MKSLKKCIVINAILLLTVNFASGQVSDCDFYWSDIPVVSKKDNKVAEGVINGIKYTYMSSEPIEFTNEVFKHFTFPATQKIPNQKCIKNSKRTKNTLIFAQPMKDPILVFSSIGNQGVIVPINFQESIEILFEKGLVSKSANSLKGREGYAVVRIPGMHSKVEFEYTVEENWANFVFGAGICNPCEFNWSSVPVVNGNKATGIINGVPYTYTSSSPVLTSNSVFNHKTFPATLKIPNQKCIRNDEITDNTLEFAKPVKDPVLVFASIGNVGVTVPIEFKQDFIVEFQTGINSVNGNKIIGKEGFLVVRFPGVYSKLEFKYTVKEAWANFVFGAAVCP